VAFVRANRLRAPKAAKGRRLTTKVRVAWMMRLYAAYISPLHHVVEGGEVKEEAEAGIDYRRTEISLKGLSSKKHATTTTTTKKKEKRTCPYFLHFVCVVCSSLISIWQTCLAPLHCKIIFGPAGVA
jgi:hypothetical protein